MITLLINSMIKELTLAIVFALLIGLGLTGTLYYLKQNQKPSAEMTTSDLSSPPASADQNPLSPTPAPSDDDLQLAIISPQNNDIINTAAVTLKGTATPDSTLVITIPKKNYSLVADSKGNFSQNIDLDSGYNIIEITAVTPNHQETHLTYYLTYSTYKL